ncbi:MAG: glycosyltransferase [Gammaproteobacteria bacterium]
MFYSQHVLGMGHLVRSLEILRALDGFDVCFVNGGEMVEGIDVPAHVRVAQLPPIKTDTEFRPLSPDTWGLSIEQTRATRRTLLLEEYETFQPEILVVELFPFGRRQFGYELVPLLARIRRAGGQSKVVCSLRDILVRKSDQARFETRVLTLMNRYFDMLLIHADPRFQSLDETFSRTGDLRAPIVYTGYVVQTARDGQVDDDFAGRHTQGKLIVASIGGGRVGYELLDAAIKASEWLKERLAHRLLIFTGPYLPDQQFAELGRRAAGKRQITLRRFTPYFLKYMQAADLSISMAGYNTCMNVLTTGVRALVLPFAGAGNDEQAIRAQKLAGRGVLTVLCADDLEAHALGGLIQQSLEAERSDDPSQVDVDGANNTAQAIATLEPGRATAGPAIARGRASETVKRSLFPALEDLEKRGKRVEIFFRDDDVDEDEDRLRELLDVAFARLVPVNLEIIPGRLTDAGAAMLKTIKGFDPVLMELDQHGWRHINHETEGKKCEFGGGRDYEQQYADIARGKRLLEEIFDQRFYPAFTPPWNRCTADTLKALDELGFAVFSKDRGKEPVTGYGFREISITLDLFTWKGAVRLRPAQETAAELAAQLQQLDRIGIMLHHKVMDAVAFDLFDALVAALQESAAVRFHTFESLIGISQQGAAASRRAQ